MTTGKSGKKRMSDDYSEQLFKSAKSIDSLASSLISRASKGRDDDDEEDDDKLFCRRLYLKLRKIPDSGKKERMKLNVEVEVLNALTEANEVRASLDACSNMSGDTVAAAAGQHLESTISLPQLLSFCTGLPTANFSPSLSHSRLMQAMQ